MITLYFSENVISKELVISKLRDYSLLDVNKVQFPTIPFIVEKNAFTDFINLTTVTNLTKAISIGDYAFENCKLTALYLDNITTLGKYAFANNNLSGEVRIKPGISIPDNCFQNANISKVITNLDKVMSVGDYAFASCYNFPDKISLTACTEIGRYAFLSCENLSNLNAPQCTFVDYNAFYGTKLWDVDPQQ